MQDKEEIIREAERTRELMRTKPSLSDAEAERIVSFLCTYPSLLLQYRDIAPSFPKFTPKSDILDIIVSNQGNIEAINREVQKYWENDVPDQWTTVITRTEKVFFFFLLLPSEANQSQKSRKRASTKKNPESNGS